MRVDLASDRRAGRSSSAVRVDSIRDFSIMRSKLAFSVLSALVFSCLGALSVGLAADPPKAKITYQDHVSAVFRSRCGSCHNPDKQKGGLNLDNYGSAMQGGGSGKVIEPGDADNSTLFLVISHKEEPKMPPNSPKIPDAEIELIRKWIEGGALENSGSVMTAKAKPKFEFKLDPAALGKPAGNPAMPENLTTEPFVPQAKPNAVVAMASSPWAPLVAVAGHKQVLLYRTTDRHLVGVLPFPEGAIYVLKFSRNGDLLLAGGGRGGQSGIAVAWDVKKGTRVFEVGKEYDAVLAADISPDHSQVVLGGPGKVVRIYNTADGSLAQEMRKHTEWITAAEFSPDGVLLATGDRNNGLIVWEANTGREFFDLRGHQAAITDVSWRLDSNVVASSSEDGTVKLWEMENGGNIKSFGAHGGGTASRPVRQGRAAAHDRPRSRGPALGPERRQAARIRAVRRPGARGRLHPRRVAGHRRRLDRRDPRLGHRRTAAGWPTWPSIRPRSPLASSKRSAPWQRSRPRRSRWPSNLLPFRMRSRRRQCRGDAGASQSHGGRAGRGAADRPGPAESSKHRRPSKPRPKKRGPSSRPPISSPSQSALAQAAAEKAIAQTAAAEKAATQALAACQGGDRKSPAEKTAQDPALAAAAAAAQGRGDARSPERGCGGARETGPEVRRAHPGARGRRHTPVGRLSGAGPGDRGQERGAPGGGQRPHGRPGGHPGRACRPRRLQSRRPGPRRDPKKRWPTRARLSKRRRPP